MEDIKDTHVFEFNGLLGRHCLTHKDNPDDKMIFGKYGYIATEDGGNTFVVCLTDSRKFLATQDFQDMTNREVQNLLCTSKTVIPMLEIIRPYARGAK